MKKKTAFLIATAGIAAGTIGAGYVLFNEVMNRDASLIEKIFNASNNTNETCTAPIDERALWFSNLEFKEYELRNDKGFKLKGYFIPSKNNSNIFVFLSHGYRSGGKGEFELIAKYYYDKGYNILMVDHQAHGESEGKYIGFGYHEYTDSLKWLDFLIDKFGSDIQIILHGISMGCATVTMMSGAKSLPENVKFTVADCGYTSAYDEILHNFKSLHVPPRPLIDIMNFFNKRVSGYDLKDAAPLTFVKNTKVPILFIHGGNDDFVPTQMVYSLYDACGSNYKDLLIVDEAEHAKSYPINSQAYENKITQFADKFLI